MRDAHTNTVAKDSLSARAVYEQEHLPCSVYLTHAITVREMKGADCGTRLSNEDNKVVQ